MQLELNYFPAAERTRPYPLLFIHGMAHAAWCWEWQFVPFFNAAGYDCYTLSLRGHGQSEGAESIRWHRIKAYVSDVEQSVSSISTSPILIGHSMGGFIVQKYLLRHDNLPAAITLSSVPAGGMWRGSIKMALRFPWRFLKGNLTLSTAPFSSSEEVVKKIAFSDNVDPALLTAVTKHMQPESYLAYLDMLFLDLHRPRPVNTPLLFLYAENDFIVDYEGWKATSTGFGADECVIPNIAHDMFLDTAWTAAAHCIKNWLHSNQL